MDFLPLKLENTILNYKQQLDHIDSVEKQFDNLNINFKDYQHVQL